jgi:hypothetical protein
VAPVGRILRRVLVRHEVFGDRPCDPLMLVIAVVRRDARRFARCFGRGRGHRRMVPAPQVITHWSDFKQGLFGLSDRCPGIGSPPHRGAGSLSVRPSCGARLAGLVSARRTRRHDPQEPWVSAPLGAYVLAFYVLFLGPPSWSFLVRPPDRPAPPPWVERSRPDRRGVARGSRRAFAATALWPLSSRRPHTARPTRPTSCPRTRATSRDWLVSHGAGRPS